MTILNLEGKDHLPELFDRLRSGRHICVDDGPIYLAVRVDFSTHRNLFAALGFQLLEHERGFYYFHATEELGKEATQLAVFFFVLLEAWGDAGKDLEATAFDPAGHAVSELPHLTRESWRQCMTEIGIMSEDDLTKVIQRMERLGFAERIADDRFRFRPPVWRFFDLCLDVLVDAERQDATDDSKDEEIV